MEDNAVDSWTCAKCTLVNLLLRPSCEACGTERPDTVIIPDGYTAKASEASFVHFNPQLMHLVVEPHRELQAAPLKYQDYLDAEQKNIVHNTETIHCIVCLCDINPGEGMVLHNCHHKFCINCLRGTIEHGEDAEVKCPGQENAEQCNQPLLEREVRAIADKEVVEKFLKKGITLAEAQEPNSFHCLTPDCPNWRIVDDPMVSTFHCEICKKPSCRRCRAIHDGQTCLQFQQAERREATREVHNAAAARLGEERLRELVRCGEAMHCPRCQVIIQKTTGCDNMRCTMCRNKFRWKPIRQ